MGEMGDWLTEWLLPADAGWERRAMLTWALLKFHEFLLVSVRLSGLFLIGPLFGRGVVPRAPRVMLIIVLAVMLVPTLPNHAERGFRLLDRNNDGELVRDEVPHGLLPRFDSVMTDLSRESGGINATEWGGTLSVPDDAIDLGMLLASELLIGLLLGLGVMILLSAFQMAGELIDQQIGTSLGGVFNPGLELSGGPSGRLLFMFATAVLLTVEIPAVSDGEPASGHLVMVDAVVHTFRTMPPGEALVSQPAIGYVVDLVHGSLVLALQVAAPVLAAMTLIAIMMGTLGYSVPQINVMMLGFPLRAVVAMGVMLFVLSGAASAAVVSIGDVLNELARQIAFGGDSLAPSGGG